MARIVDVFDPTERTIHDFEGLAVAIEQLTYTEAFKHKFHVAAGGSAQPILIPPTNKFIDDPLDTELCRAAEELALEQEIERRLLTEGRITLSTIAENRRQYPRRKA